MSAKKEFEERTVVQKVCIKETTICDVCKKEITGEHWHIVTGHSDWGCDSVDSIEIKDACSKECAQQMFDEYFERSAGRMNSESIEIEHYNEP